MRAAELARQIASDEAQLGKTEAELLETAPALAESLRTTAPVLTLEQVASHLPSDTLLVELMFLGEDLLAWAVDRQGLAGAFAVSLDARELTTGARRFHAICRERGPVRELAAALGDRLLGTFEPLLRRVSSLVIVPYGAAHLLPFHALTVGGRLLGDTHRVSYLPSASALQYLQRSSVATPAAPPRLLAVGDPRAMSFRAPLAERAVPLAPLPAAAAEATYVSSLFAPDATLLVGPDATEAAVRRHLAAHSLLHLATHGNLVDDAPLASSLSLADGDELTVYELMGERLDADLVVLSACETARGATTGGDDVLGLTRALLAAGARRAVVSLWPVDDVSTSLVMGRFYRGVRAGEEPAEALASAQRQLRAMTPAEITEALASVEERLRKSGAADLAALVAAAPRARGPAADVSPPYSHPYYWAPFILIG
jgi:CHAT domain-containing protein